MAPDESPAGRLVAGVLEGESLAAASLDRVRAGCSNPDEVLHCVLSALASDGRIIPPSPALRGACRRLQKALEGAAD